MVGGPVFSWRFWPYFRLALTKGRRGRGVDKAWAHRRLLLRPGATLTDNAAHRLEDVLNADDATGKLQAV